MATDQPETCSEKRTFLIKEAEIDVECGKVPHGNEENHSAKFTDPTGGRIWFIWDAE